MYSVAMFWVYRKAEYRDEVSKQFCGTVFAKAFIESMRKCLSALTFSQNKTICKISLALPELI